MSTEPIIEEFRRLSATEKIRLVQRLWDEIADEAAHRPLTEAQKKLLDELIDEHERDPGVVEPWEEVREQILRKL